MSTDIFARIAMGQHPFDKNRELCKWAPVSHSKKYFTKSDATCARPLDRSRDERLADFYTRLDELRKQYAPYMLNHTPPQQIMRKVTELKEFDFRFETDEDKKDISRVMDGQGSWEHVTIPHYGGPVGKWTAFYRTTFEYPAPDFSKRVILRFAGSDYITGVYLNGRFVGSHEGFFAPFEFDVTDLLHDKNVLVAEIQNDIPTVGLDNEDINGDKIYAATGLGWDGADDGWHHCPPGAGIYNKVTLEERGSLFAESIFIRPDNDRSSAEIRAQVYNPAKINRKLQLTVSIFPFNFTGEPIEEIAVEGAESAGPGINYYRCTVDMAGFRMWTPDTPWLYAARVSVKDESGTLTDQLTELFGMRKFHMDETAEDKGTLYLNDRPVILRGANDMGHMQLCVTNGNFEQLIDDILIAKLANMNFYRFTQRPVQEEIYRYCDMLGMMNQTDLPLFGFLRRNQLYEAIRQSGEMERLIRNHPSSIMVTYINEAMAASKLGYRHLYRDELEAFFEAADRVVRFENPDRVIKHVEGDYDAPTGTGLSDFHCYNMWYTNHALTIGRLYKGWLPATKKGWKTGCGEYGTEGLDNHDLMLERYPKHWLPADESDRWIPDKIVLSQTNSMHGDWYEEQADIKSWIAESQKHQAFATKLMTMALRRRSDKVISTAVHLLIDAWPAGWMKTLMGVDRVPKPAYFAYAESLKPIKLDLRCDRWTARSGETIDVEVRVLNDLPDTLENMRVIATVRDDTAEYGSYEVKCGAAGCSPAYAGEIHLKLPEVRCRKPIHIDAVLSDNTGAEIDTERFTVKMFPPRENMSGRAVSFLGKRAQKLAAETGVSAAPFEAAGNDIDTLVISDTEGYKQNSAQIEAWIEAGGRAIFLLPDSGSDPWEISGKSFQYKMIMSGRAAVGVKAENSDGLSFVARNAQHGLTESFRPDDFSYWYNGEKDHIDSVAVTFIDSDDLEPLLFTYRKPSFQDRVVGQKHRMPVAGELMHGRGAVYFLSLSFEDRVEYNPVLDEFLIKLLNGGAHQK